MPRSKSQRFLCTHTECNQVSFLRFVATYKLDRIFHSAVKNVKLYNLCAPAIVVKYCLLKLLNIHKECEMHLFAVKHSKKCESMQEAAKLTGGSHYIHKTLKGLNSSPFNESSTSSKTGL